MKKLMCAISAVMLCTLMIATSAFAANGSAATGDLSIELVSPGDCEGMPIFEETVVSKITNNSDTVMNDLLVYITIIDTKNNIAVAVDEYGPKVDKPRQIESLAAHESITIEIPIRYMYVGEYELYTSVMHKGSNTVISSSPITIHMIGESKINSTYVLAVAIVVPTYLLLVAAWIWVKRKRKQ